ncbi:MAG: acyl-CoA dehydrogenase family protein [Acidimicrobiales bacterium]
MDFSLSEEQARLQGIARKFAYEEIWPLAQELDKEPVLRDAYPEQLVRRASELGLRTMKLPREHGGLEVDVLTEVVVMEELAVGDCGFAMTLAHAWREGSIMARWTTPEQRERFLPDFIADPTYLTCNASTEDHAGSDHGLPYTGDLQAGAQTSAVLDGDHWVINGRKRFITNGNVARMLIVWARTDPTKPWVDGVSAIFVPTDSPGFRVGRTERKFGLRLNQNTELIFEDCRVPKDNLVGKLNDGRRLREATFVGSKAKEAARSLGVARAAYELATAWAHQRVQGGSVIIEHESVATRLAQVLQEIELARTIIWRAAWAVEHDVQERSRPLEDFAMLYTSEMAMRAVSQCIRIFGARGSLQDWPMEKLVRDAATMMLPPIGNEASWVRVSRYLKEHVEAAPLMAPPDGAPTRLPFTPPS